MATVEFAIGNKMHLVVSSAIAIIKRFANLQSVPTVYMSNVTDANAVVFSHSLGTFARRVQCAVVSFIESRCTSATGKRKRSINGSVYGVVRAWGELAKHDKVVAGAVSRVSFQMLE